MAVSETTKRVDPDSEAIEHVYSSLLEECVPNSEGKLSVLCCTEHTQPGTNITFRATRWYRGGPWNNWALFSWEDKGATLSIPGRIEFFVGLGDCGMKESIALKPNSGFESGLYAVIQSLEKEPAQYNRSNLVQHGTLDRKQWYLVPVNSIVEQCFAIPDVSEKEEKVDHFLVLVPKSKWADLF